MREIVIRPAFVDTNPLGSFWVEVKTCENKFEWIGNLHNLKSGEIEACPDGAPCKTFNDPYKATEYIKQETGSW